MSHGRVGDVKEADHRTCTQGISRSEHHIHVAAFFAWQGASCCINKESSKNLQMLHVF